MMTLDWTILVAAAIFLVTLFGLTQLLFRPLFRVLDERREVTSDLRQRAQEILGRYQLLLEKYQERIQEEKKSGYKLAESVRNETLKERQRRISEAQAEAKSLVERARSEIRQELVFRPRSGSSGEADKIAQIIAVKVLGRA